MCVYTRYAIIKVSGPHPPTDGDLILVLYINECMLLQMRVCVCEHQQSFALPSTEKVPRPCNITTLGPNLWEFFSFNFCTNTRFIVLVHSARLEHLYFI